MPVKKVTAKKTTVKKGTSVAKKTTKPELIDFLREVEKRAYELYEERMNSGAPSDDMADWFQAEKEIKAKYKL